MKTLILTAAMLLGYTVSAMAQNPCTVASTGLILNPGHVYVTIPEYNTLEADGSFRNSQYQYAAFAASVTDPNASGVTPVQGPSTVPRNAFTPVAGFADCYIANFPQLIPTSAQLKLAIKAQRLASATIPAAEGPWTISTMTFSFAPTVLAQTGRPVPSR